MKERSHWNSRPFCNGAFGVRVRVHLNSNFLLIANFFSAWHNFYDILLKTQFLFSGRYIDNSIFPRHTKNVIKKYIKLSFQFNEFLPWDLRIIFAWKWRNFSTVGFYFIVTLLKMQLYIFCVVLALAWDEVKSHQHYLTIKRFFIFRWSLTRFRERDGNNHVPISHCMYKSEVIVFF